MLLNAGIVSASAGDPVENIILRLNPGGANNDTSYISDDGFARSLTFVGAAKISSAQASTNSTSFRFESTSDKIVFTGDSNSLLTGKALTFDLDLRLDSIPTSGLSYIFLAGSSGSNFCYVGIQFTGSVFEPLFDFISSTGTFNRFKSPSTLSSSIFMANTWQRIRIVVPSASFGISAAIYFYVDGVYYGLSQDPFTPQAPPISLGTGIGQGGDIAFGPGAGGGGNSWSGYIDNITWYNEALSGQADYTP